MLANLARLKQRMDEVGADALVATTRENVCYLTGIESVALEMFPHTGQCYAVVVRECLDRPYFICSRCEIDQFLDAVPTLADAIPYGTFYRELRNGTRLSEPEERLERVTGQAADAATALDALVHLLRRLGSRSVLVDEDGVPYGFLEALAERLGSLHVTPGAELLRWVRQVKTPAEIERIAAAAEVTEQGIVAAAAIAEPGVTELELTREFERTIAGLGARPKFTLIKIGRRAVAGQTRPGHEPLRRGETIWFDVGCVYQGYWADLARVFSLGEPASRVKDVYDAMLAGEERALAETRVGMTGRDVFELTVEAVREAGVEHYRRHHVGHGIGVEVYDRVHLTPTNDDVLEENTVVNIETPYYEFGLGALHVEDPFVVRERGNDLLTRLGRELHVLA